MDNYRDMEVAVECDEDQDDVLGADGYPVLCDFIGIVDAIDDGNHLYWTCPRCGADRQERGGR